MAVEVKRQTASQDYDCDDQGCEVLIAEETSYVRVSYLERTTYGHNGRTAARIEKYHEACWDPTGLRVTNG